MCFRRKRQRRSFTTARLVPVEEEKQERGKEQEEGKCTKSLVVDRSYVTVESIRACAPVGPDGGL